MPVIELTGFEELTQDIGRLENIQDKYYSPIHDAISEGVLQIEDEMKANLERNGSIAFGQLRASIGSQVTQTETEIVGMAGTNLGKAKNGKLVGYGPAVETGSRPHWTPLQPLIAWVRVKRMSGVYSIKNKRRIGNKILQRYQDEELAQRIRLKIAKHGTKAHPFFKPAIEAKREEIMRLVEEGVDELVDVFNRSK